MKNVLIVAFMHACSATLVVFSSVTLRAVALQTPLPIASSRQEYWSGSPCPPPGDLPDPGIESTSESPALQADSYPLKHLGSPSRLYSHE